ncbi:hypothetical protein FRC12_015053 [Ceratobasidium sp. 428]|nr:hypothetical protein FRC12_015053 [Ceratobasidium sp. 428]
MTALGISLARTTLRSWTTSFGLAALPTPAPSVQTAGKLSLLLPSLRTLLELFPPIVLAVPKKKTSHSKKRMRSANKGLKDKISMSAFPLLVFGW